MSRPSMELADIGARIVADNRKNNHCTADPIFLVEARKRVYGIDMEHDPAIAWLHGDEYTELDKEQSAIAEKFFESHVERPVIIADGIAYGDGHAAVDFDGADFVSDLRRVGYQEYWEFVQPFFTKEAAEYFIATNSHNYPKGLRVYVASAYRNWEWQALREHLKSAAKPVETTA